MIRALTVALLVVCAAPVLAQKPAFKVTYLTSTTAYIDAGSDDGVTPGDRVEVIRAGAVIAVLRVTDVSSHRSACTIESSTATLSVGDGVKLAVPGPSATPEAEAVEPEPVVASRGSSGESWARRNGLRGRIGVRYLGVFDRSGFGSDVREPSLDVRLDGTRIGGSSFDAQIDVRARHTVQTVADGRQFDDGQARVYRANARWHTRTDNVQVTLGRQFSSALASISTFDGAEFTYNRQRWSLGMFAGTQPEPIDYGFSTDITEYGTYLRLRAAPGSSLRWEWVTAAIGSYEQGHINREYVALLGRAMTSRLMLMVQQDVDVNRGWKRDMGEDPVSLTNTFATVRVRANRTLDLDAGYDNRRNIRLYRNFVSPETEFDDAYRQGVWGGVGVGFANRYRVGASARSSIGGSAGDAMSYTVLAAANRLTPAQLDLRLRSTRYANNSSEGWMHTLAAGYSVSARFRMELFGGTRDDTSKLFSVSDTSTRWLGANMDIDVARSLYFSVSGERNTGGDESYNQVYSGLSWRF